MKIKVRGLVFFGFAAAVFAQSAFATDSEEVIATKKKTVTSQYYVEDKFNTAFGGTEGQVILQGATAGTTSYQTAGNTSDYINTSDTGTYAGDGKLVTGKAVAQAIAAAQTVATNIIGDDDYIDTENVMDGSTLIGKKVKVISSSVTDGTAASITDSNTTASGESVAAKDKLATAGAVYNYAQDKSKFVAATSTTTGEGQNAVTTWASGITGNADQNDKYPSSKAVYEFVTGAISTAGNSYQPKVVDNTHAKLYIGMDDSSAGATWKELSIANASGQNPALASTSYVAKTVDGGVYTVNLDSAQIADSIATDASAKLVTENAVYDLVDREVSSGTSTIGSQSTTLVPTSKNVYDFVNNGYQVKATAGASTIEVGHDGAWANLVGDSTYTNVAMDSSSAKVSLINVTTGSNATEFVPSSDTTNAANRTKLARAGDVYDFVTGMNPGGLTIPAIPTACSTAITSTSGKTCALVMAWNSTTNAIGLEWTVMAQ